MQHNEPNTDDTSPNDDRVTMPTVLSSIQSEKAGTNADNEIQDFVEKPRAQVSEEDNEQILEETKLLEQILKRMESEVEETCKRLVTLSLIRDEKLEQVKRSKIACNQLEKLVKLNQDQTKCDSTSSPTLDSTSTSK